MAILQFPNSMFEYPRLFPFASSAYNFFTRPAESMPNGSESRQRYKLGQFRAIREQFEIIDTSRPTQAYKKYQGSSTRVLRGEVWRPLVRQQNKPLVIYSHGFMSNCRESVYLMRFLASHGYTVAAVNYPLTHMRAPNGPHAQDLVNQPGDISFLIDYLLERNANTSDPIHHSIDANKIALTGISLGGLTSMLATFHPHLLDARIAAVVSVAAPTTIFANGFFADSSTPSLMIYGDADSLVLYDDHALPVMSKMPGATLVTLRKGSHTGFVQPASTFLRFLRNPDRIAFLTFRVEKADKPWDFVPVLGGEEIGIIQPDAFDMPTSLLTSVAMKANRQQMFTTLASHAFLETVFADDVATRNSAYRYLHEVMPEENWEELSVSRSIQ